jgi:hypothetical protein
LYHVINFIISNLKKDHIEFCDNKRIKVEVIKGKGGKSRKFLTIQEDKYLYDELKKLVNSTKDDENIFYSGSYMRKKARKLGFKSHDLRKVFSQIVYYMDDGRTAKEKIELIQKLRT